MVAVSAGVDAAKLLTRVGEDLRFPIEIKGGRALRERLRVDLASVRKALQEAAMPEEERSQLLKRADELVAQVEAVPADLPPGFRVIFPVNDLHAGILALNAHVLRARGLQPLTAWSENRWDPLFPTQAPSEPPAEPPSLRVALMHGEYRSEAFNLTNATDKLLRCRVKLKGLPGGDNPDWVSVREVLFTDSYVHLPIAAPLSEARRVRGGFEVTIPAGMTRQVWLEFHPTSQSSELHRGEIAVTASGIREIRIPLQVYIYPLDLPARLSIAVGGWDYSHDEATVRDAAIVGTSAYVRFLRGYGVNTPWAAHIPIDGCKFDAEGRLTEGPDFAGWDRWIAAWKDAKYYAVFLSIGDPFFDEEIGTPRFKRMVGEWFASWMKHAGKQGIEPDRIPLLIADEPSEPKKDAVIIAYAEAIKAVEADALIYQDPLHEKPEEVDPRFYEVSDVLCPNTLNFIARPESYRDFFAAQQRAGRELWLYSCAVGKYLDPTTYWRGQFWQAIQRGAKGSFYWAFCDEGGSRGSFYVYSSPGAMYCPFFMDAEMGIIDGKHMQAIREGAEDYEYFAMLRDRVAELDARGGKSAALDAARYLLEHGPARVTREISTRVMGWDVQKDRGLMDEVRIQVLDVLAGLRAVHGPTTR